jgi:Carboxypeptidase regulatory-like domain
MLKAQDQIGSLRIAVPCPATWEGMAGDERVRHCTLCNLNVYNFAEMTGDEVRRLLERTEGRVCARLYQRADGTVLTRDCPTGLRALRRRASRVAAALIAALLTLPSLAFAGTDGKKLRLKTHGSKIKLRIERVATPQSAVFNGVIRDPAGIPIPGTNITVQNEASKREITAVTDVNGAFNIASLNDGLYRVEVTLPGFKPARMEHLQLKASEVTHATVALLLDSAITITVGEVVMDPIMRNGGIPLSTTYSQDFIRKMPF